MKHFFDVEIAKKYGIKEAILLENLYYWINKNKANNKHFYEGRFWTYNSSNAFTKLFPYLTKRQIDYALKKLIDEGVIVTGNFNENKFDRTHWYAFSDLGISILQKCKMDVIKSSNEDDEIVTPIPYNKQYNKPNNKPNTPYVESGVGESVEKAINYMNELAGTSFKTTTAKTRSLIRARLKEGFTIEDLLDVIYLKYHTWYKKPIKFNSGRMSDYYYKPTTLFGTNFEDYLEEYKQKLKKC